LYSLTFPPCSTSIYTRPLSQTLATAPFTPRWYLCVLRIRQRSILNNSGLLSSMQWSTPYASSMFRLIDRSHAGPSTSRLSSGTLVSLDVFYRSIVRKCTLAENITMLYGRNMSTSLFHGTFSLSLYRGKSSRILASTPLHVIPTPR